MRKTKFTLFLFFIVSNFTTFAQKKTSSVLSSGDFYKFSIENTGLYKLTYDYLKGIPEIDIDNVDPRAINIYNSGGGIVPQVLNDARIDDLAAIPILINGESDGSFDQGDYIIVYLEGANRFQISKEGIQYDQNVYSLKNYFFIKTNDSGSVRVDRTPSISNPENVSTSTDVIIRHEQERLNLLGQFGSTQGSGKQWFGESFSNEPEQNFNRYFEFPNLIPGTEANIEVNFAARASQTTSYEIEIDGQVFSASISSTSLGNVEAVYAKTKKINERIFLNSTQPNINVRFNNTGTNQEAWLDYIQITTKSKVAYNNSPLFIYDISSSEFDTYGFEMTSTPSNIWDITDITNITSYESSNNTFAYATENEVKTFVAFNDGDVSELPTYEGQIENQNLHAIDRADLVILYYKEFEDAAIKLANHRLEQDGLIAVAIDVAQIYNEFGGENDPSAIRDFLKMIYDRDDSFRYLLLLGDATYDFRGLDANLAYQNFVPTYETNQSLHPVEAFPSDDFYALLSGNEGGDSLDGALDIGVGRIPAKTATEALAVIDKIIHYDTNPNTQGDWKLRVGFTADDEDSNTHIRQADGIATITDNNHPEMNLQKVYFDAFNQEATPGGARYPDAKNALLDNFFKGQLVLNYLGHGGPIGWAQERVFQVSDISNLKNIDRLPLLITATCSFTGFDEPSVVSAGEESLLNPSGGAIALFSTVRAVYSSQNERITREVFETIFTRTNEGKALRFGDIIRESQNANSSDTISSNTRKFLLFGDPSQTLALPKYNISLTSINDAPISTNQIDTLGALGRMKIKGQIEDHNAAILSSFNGDLSLTVFDKPSNLKTLDNDAENRVFDFELQQNVLYKGSASVTDGVFEIEFVLPQDINFEFGKGKISLYATDNASLDAGGFYDKIVIGGTSNNNIADNEGPEIDIYFDDRSFIAGGQTGNSPVLIVDLADENGINLSSTSIGHDIIANIDEDNSDNIVLNDFFSPTLDEVGSGTVEYQLTNLTPGLHSISIKAWDILNNSSQAQSEFLVVDSEEGFINNLKNFPNPFTTETFFSFEHDLNNSNLEIVVTVYSTSGQVVKTINTQRVASSRLINDISWSENGDYERNLSKGIYFYKINITSPELNLSRESDFQKLVILN